MALSGQCCGASGAPNQRGNQMLEDPFKPNRTYEQWLNFGRVTSAANDPRILQLGLKYQF